MDVRGGNAEDLVSKPGEHCLHWQEGDSDCHKCGLANWCPEDWAERRAVPEDEIPPITGCPGGLHG